MQISFQVSYNWPRTKQCAHIVQSPSIVETQVPSCHTFQVGTNARSNVSSDSFSSSPPQSKVVKRMLDEAYCGVNGISDQQECLSPGQRAGDSGIGRSGGREGEGL